jgi:hypothetical protein
MAVRVFDYANFTAGSRITLGIGTLATFRTGGILNGAHTHVVCFKPVGSTTDSTQFLISYNAGTSVRGGLSYTTAGVLQFVLGGTTVTFPTMPALVNGKWYVFAVEFPGGTSTPVGRLWNLTDNTSTGWINASGTRSDDSNVLTNIQLGNRPSDFPQNGKQAGHATYSSALGAARDTLGTGFPAWLAAGPVGMWPLTQASTATAVTDEVGTADQTALLLTSVDNADDPPNFSLSLGGGGTDLPYDADAVTPRLAKSPAGASLAAASDVDARGPRPARLAPAGSATAAATAADGRSPRLGRMPASSATAVAASADGRAGSPTRNPASSSLSIEMRADAVGPRPAPGLAIYELTESGAVDLPFDADGLGPRAPVALARGALDEVYRPYPRPPSLSRSLATARTDAVYSADTRVPLMLRNAAARVLADQAVEGMAMGGWLARGLAHYAMSSGQPLPADVFADFEPVVVVATPEGMVVKANFLALYVAGWQP